MLSKRNHAKTSNKSVSVPVALTKPTKTQKPIVSGNPYQTDGSVRIKHREFVSDVFSTGDLFFNRSYPIQPGVTSVFPWLSCIANRFESYRFHKLRFSYEPVCSTSTPGSIMLAVDFDASDPQAESKVQLMSYHNAVRIAPWCNITYESSNQDLKKFAVQRYVRSTAVAGDIKTYDVGTFQLASANVVTDEILGELYVEYDVELYTPQTSFANNSISILADGVVIGGTSVTFGPATSIITSTPGLVSLDTNTLRFNAKGNFLIAFMNGLTVSAATYSIAWSTTLGIYPLSTVTTSPVVVTNAIIVVEVKEIGATISFTRQGAASAADLVLRITSWDQPLF